jgi:hypothetical protein
VSRTFRTALSVAAIAGAILLGPLAQAQTFNTGPAALARQMSTIYAPHLATINRMKVLENRRKLGASEAPGPAPGRASKSGASPAGDTTFRPARFALVPPLFAARLGKTPEERRYIEKTLDSCLDHYVELARRRGGEVHDVARAVSYFILTNYVIYRRGEVPTQPQIDAMRALLLTNMSADDTLRHMTNRQKQEAYETLIVLAGFADLGYGTMRNAGNEAGAEQFRAFAGQNLQTLLGVPPEKLHFTEEGPQVEQ